MNRPFNRARAATNVLSEAGFLFNVGNTVMNAQQGLAAAAFPATAAVICAAIRAASECQAQGRKLPLPGIVVKATKNPGAALATSGFLLASSGALIAMQGKADFGAYSTALPAAIPLILGTSNMIVGFARGFKESGVTQKALDAVGQSLMATGAIMASGDAPLPVKACFALSGAVAIVAGLLNKRNLGVLTPNRLNALGAGVTAFTHGNPFMMVANGIWALAYCGLDALQSVGGVYQVFNRASRRAPQIAAPAVTKTAPEPQAP